MQPSFSQDSVHVFNPSSARQATFALPLCFLLALSYEFTTLLCKSELDTAEECKEKDKLRHQALNRLAEVT
jgi:hypothetical protein